MPALRVIGPGRAGQSLMRALERADWTVEPPLRRGDDVAGAASGVDVLVVATPDSAIAGVARAVAPVPTTAVVHLAGSLGLDVLVPHPRRGAVHPLAALPDADVGATRLVGGWFAIAGDRMAGEIVAALGGRSFVIADDDRAAYHAAACIAGNHLVALLGQVERVARSVGVPFEALVELSRGALENVAALGPAAALTGPVARGDWETVRRHVDALDPSERVAYTAMAQAAHRLVTVTPTEVSACR